MKSDPTTYGIENHGISNPGDVYWNLSTPRLYEEALIRREGRLSHLGPLVVRTGQHTGRSPDDRFIVPGPAADQVWWGNVNRAIDPERCARLKERLAAYLQGKDLFVQDCFALDGGLARAARRKNPVFGFEVPQDCPAVPHDVLDPRNTWADKHTYDAQAAKLAALFMENFKTFEDEVSEEVRAAGPRIEP